MAGIADIFTPSFAFSLAICLLLTGLIGVYFTQKIAEQNHKMSSMLELVSTLANEVSLMRGHIFSQHPTASLGGNFVQQQYAGSGANVSSSDGAKSINVNLIPVSDDENKDDDDDDDDDDDEDSDDDKNEDSGDDNDEDSDDDKNDDDDDDDDKNDDDDDKNEDSDDDEEQDENNVKIFNIFPHFSIFSTYFSPLGCPLWSVGS